MVLSIVKIRLTAIFQTRRLEYLSHMAMPAVNLNHADFKSMNAKSADPKIFI